MSEFYSLAEFLRLREDYGYQRSIFREHRPAHFFPWLYDISKRSWEMYGDDGPPVGSKVYTLMSGMGNTGVGAVRTFDGDDARDARFFIVRKGANPYLVDRRHWWAIVTPIDVNEGEWDVGW